MQRENAEEDEAKSQRVTIGALLLYYTVDTLLLWTLCIFGFHSHSFMVTH